MEEKYEVPGKTNMTPHDRQLLWQRLMLRCFRDGKLQRGAIQEEAAAFNIIRRTVSGFWARISESLKRGTLAEFESRKRNNSRPKKPLNIITIKAAPLSSRTTLRSLSVVADKSPATLCRRVKSGAIKHIRALCPPFKH